MVTGSQYGEHEIIHNFFNKPPYTQLERDKYLVDVGAADGVDNSNSYQLLKWSWNGLLVEPNPQYFMDLLKLYSKSRTVQLSNYGVSDVTARKIFSLNGQCSSLEYKIGVPIEIQCVTLTDLFILYKVPQYFEFLSIDCEGHDMAVLRSLDWKRWSISLVCVEHSMDKVELDHFMKSVGYKLHARTQGNSFYA